MFAVIFQSLLEVPFEQRLVEERRRTTQMEGEEKAWQAQPRCRPPVFHVPMSRKEIFIAGVRNSRQISRYRQVYGTF